jgi:hypothetical protein
MWTTLIMAKRGMWTTLIMAKRGMWTTLIMANPLMIRSATSRTKWMLPTGIINCM